MSMHTYQTETIVQWLRKRKDACVRAWAHEPGVERISAIILSSSLFFSKKTYAETGLFVAQELIANR